MANNNARPRILCPDLRRKIGKTQPEGVRSPQVIHAQSGEGHKDRLAS